MNFLTSYPFATASSAAFYALLIAMLFPSSRVRLMPLFEHPIPPNQKYLFGFDTLRGFAAAFVAIGHCWWATYPVFASSQLKVSFLAYGAKGVPIFAVLSGFLIYRSARSAIKSIDRLRDYGIRRFFRIYPVYALAVMLCVLTSQYVASDNNTATNFFTSDLFMFPVFGWPIFANPPTWSLYIEVAFYAFLPIAMIVFGPRRMVLFSIVGIIAMVAGDYESRIFALWKFFLFGIIASELSQYLKFKSASVLLAVGTALLVLDFRGPEFDWAAHLGIGRLHMDGQSLGLGIACGMILSSLEVLPLIGRVLNVAPLRFIGIISYSVYVTHFFYIKASFPEIVLFTQAGSQEMFKHFSSVQQWSAWYLPLAFFPGVLFWGAVSFLLVERPGMQLGNYLIARRRNQLAPANTATSSPAE